MSDNRKPESGRKPTPKVQPSGYFRGADESRRDPDRQEPTRQDQEPEHKAPEDAGASKVGEEKAASQPVERQAQARTAAQVPAEERQEAVRTLYNVDAVRDDPYAQAIPQGVSSGAALATHEASDVGLKILIAAGVVVLGLIVVALIFVTILTRTFYSSPETQPQGGSAVETKVPPAAVELRANPLPAWQSYAAGAEARLNSYGWVDQAAGVARIPIDRAMTLLIQGVHPVMGGTDAATPTATPTPDGS